MMRVATGMAIGIALLSAPGWPRAEAQTAPVPPKITRTVVASGKLPSVVGTPEYFRVLKVSLPSTGASRFTGPNGIFYQLYGGSTVTLGGAANTLAAGQGLVVPAGVVATVSPVGGEPSILLDLLLAPAAALNQPVAATAEELFRSPAPLPGLKPGPYDINLSRITFPPGMPSNPPHHRSGGAVYYIVSGTGANTIDGRTIPRPPGSLIYEPFGMVHQWGNPGPQPLTFLAFNVNPEGAPAVLPDTQANSPAPAR